ncbi:MAG: mechanosensitive ion channel family protein [Anaerolineae bacterium]
MPQEIDVSSTSWVILVFVRIAICIAIVIVGRWLARFARRWTHAGFQRTHAPESLANTLERAVYFGVLVLMVVAALIVLGVPWQLAVAVMAFVLVLAIVALRETLRDVAATVIIVVFQPFRVGDRIETNGVVGDVKEISIFHTVLIRLDNRQLIIPNGLIQSTPLINYSALDKIRLDIPVSLSYADNLDIAKSTLLEIARADTRVMPEPSAWVDVMDLGDNGVGLVLRAFTTPTDFWALRPALTERIKLEFDKRSLTIPFPQMQLHVDSGPGETIVHPPQQARQADSR